MGRSRRADETSLQRSGEIGYSSFKVKTFMKHSVELWTALIAPGSSHEPRGIAGRAARLEADGWDGAVCVDSQLLVAEAFTVLMWCAQVTKKLKLGVGT